MSLSMHQIRNKETPNHSQVKEEKNWTHGQTIKSLVRYT